MIDVGNAHRNSSKISFKMAKLYLKLNLYNLIRKNTWTSVDVAVS